MAEGGVEVRLARQQDHRVDRLRGIGRVGLDLDVAAVGRQREGVVGALGERRLGGAVPALPALPAGSGPDRSRCRRSPRARGWRSARRSARPTRPVRRPPCCRSPTTARSRRWRRRRRAPRWSSDPLAAPPAGGLLGSARGLPVELGGGELLAALVAGPGAGFLALDTEVLPWIGGTRRSRGAGVGPECRSRGSAGGQGAPATPHVTADPAGRAGGRCERAPGWPGADSATGRNPGYPRRARPPRPRPTPGEARVLVVGFPAGPCGTNCWVLAPGPGERVRHRRPRQGRWCRDRGGRARARPVARRGPAHARPHRPRVVRRARLRARGIPAYVHPDDRGTARPIPMAGISGQTRDMLSGMTGGLLRAPSRTTCDRSPTD